MNLTTERLLLRNYSAEDWERVHIYGSDPDFSKYKPWGPNTLEDTHKFIAEMIQEAESNRRYK